MQKDTVKIGAQISTEARNKLDEIHRYKRSEFIDAAIIRQSTYRLLHPDVRKKIDKLMEGANVKSNG